jgi:hypothetical protein
LPPRNVVGRHRVDGVGIDFFVNYHQVPARAGVSKDHGPARGSADVCVRRVLEHLFDFFLGDTMLGAVLDIAVGGSSSRSQMIESNGIARSFCAVEL